MAITLINSPPFVFNPSPIADSHQNLRHHPIVKKIIQIALKVLIGLQTIISFGKAMSLDIVQRAPRIYFEYVFEPTSRMTSTNLDARILALTGYVAFATLLILGGAFIKTCKKTCHEQKKAPTALEKLAGPLDPTHLRSNEIELNTKNVPKSLNITELLAIFDQINFTNPEKAGYFPPSSRQEQRRLFSAVELKEGLKQFVSRVENRTPFLGTPPSKARELLAEFYQQIEDAVRLSLHKAKENLAQAEKYGANSNEYRNARDDLSRIALDLAIAGTYCGARYMSEAMCVHERVCGGKQPLTGSLEHHLIELLANERKRIAIENIASQGASPHFYAISLRQMGRVLGLPHTKNVVEYLNPQFNLNTELRSFFLKYTPQRIIAAVQAEFKTSQNFREQFIDWAKSQIRDWNLASYQIDHEILEKLTKALFKDEVDLKEEEDLLGLFQSCYSIFMNNKAGSFLREKSWDSVLDELFADEKVKSFLKQTFPETIKRLGIVNNLKENLKETVLGKECLARIAELSMKKKCSFSSAILPLWEKLKRVRKAQKIVSLSHEALLNVLNLKTDLIGIYKAYLQQQREHDFLEALNLQDIAENGISPKLMNWLLISHGIFKTTVLP